MAVRFEGVPERKRERSRERTNDDEQDEKRRREEDEAEAARLEQRKKEPLSLEQRLKEIKEQNQVPKPVFLTKQQRAELALKRRQEEVDEQRRRLEEQRTSVNRLLKPNERERRQEELRRVAERQQSRQDREKEKEKEAIKAMYLGVKKEKKKIVKPSEKFKFSFDWEATEDTSRDNNPLYNNKHEAQLLFGRGMRAGFDRREQKKSSNYTELLEQQRKKSAEADLAVDAQESAVVAEQKERQEAQMREAKVKEQERLAKQLEKDTLKGKHWSEKKLDEMTERDWRILKEDFEIAVKGGNASDHPIRSWDESGLPEELLLRVKKEGYKKPSPIQMACIPLGLRNRDVIGIAETGSGKTCAFVFPMLVYISRLPKLTKERWEQGPYSLILAPTRELAAQIDEEATKFATSMGFTTMCVVGGGGIRSIEEQGFSMGQGMEIIIATPGRLIDCLERSLLVLNQCNYVVLDEADRMIDMGFEPQVNAILDRMPSSNMKPIDEELEERDRVYRQTFMFSATMPAAVERLAKKFLRRPIYVAIGVIGHAVDRIEQRIRMCKEADKKNLLMDQLQNGPEPPIMVFVNSKKGTDVLAKSLEKAGMRSAALHGGKTQEQRETALEGFKDGRFEVLVCTDIAGRGIDVRGVTHVINFDMAKNIEDYTHRIGRTGRAGKTGIATTFLTKDDQDTYWDLVQMLTAANQTVPYELASHEAAKRNPREEDKKGKGGRKGVIHLDVYSSRG